MRARPLYLLILAFVGAFLLPARLWAWTEARPAGLVTEVSVDREGGAEVTLRIRWRILAGRLQQFELEELPMDLTILEASAITATGTPVALTTRTPAPGRLEVSLGDESGGVRRGSVDVVLRYTTSLRAQGAIQRAGADAVIELSTIPWERGLEAAEIRLAVPTSERRAQWIADDTPGIDATTTTEPARDIVHALRRHIPAGTRWTARFAVDPNLFPWLSTGVLRAPQVIHHEPSHMGAAVLYGAVLVVLLLAVARALAGPVRPASFLPRRLALLPVVLVALAGVLQASASVGLSPGLTVGTLLLLVALALRVPPPRPVVAVDLGAPAVSLSAREVNALLPARSRSPVALTVGAVVAAALAFAGARTTGMAGMVLGTLAVDLVVGVLAWRVLRRDNTLSDVALLMDVARRVDRLVAKSGCARTGWTLRGDPKAAGALCVRLNPRNGWRFARGVRKVEWSVARRPGTLGWHASVVAIVRVEKGAPVVRSLRSLTSRVGSLRASTEGEAIAYTVELVGPDRSAFFVALRSLLSELFVKSRVPVVETTARAASPGGP